MGLFKSKEEKELEARIKVRQNLNELKKCKTKMERKKSELIRFAQDAKRQGISQQYKMAVSGLKMIMTYQKRCDAMILQIQMTETMRDLTSMSGKFFTLMGEMGKQVAALSSNSDFMKNQAAFEKGMMASEAAMDKLESFLEDAGMDFGEMSDTDVTDDVDTEIERLIDAAGAAEIDAMDDDIDRRLAESEKKRASLKE